MHNLAVETQPNTREITQPSAKSPVGVTAAGAKVDCSRKAVEKYDRRSGAPPVKLSLGREGLAVVFDVCLGRFRSVVHCMLLVSAS